MRRLRLVLAALLAPTLAHAQAVPPSLPPTQNAPSVRWVSIDAPHVRVIVPRELEREGQRVANLIEGVYGSVSRTLRRQPRRIALIIQSHRADANGFVTLGPRRSEWFATPPQSSDLLGGNDWFDLLGLHEFRHVVQFDRLNAGLTRVAYWLFGEAGWETMASLAAPPWFWEGDAVGTETGLSRSGRGRIPEFDEAERAIRAGGRRDSYWKAMWGSYEEFVPDHYVLGYAITTHVKRRYGADAWRRVLARASRIAPVPNAFSIALRQVTGKGAPALYREAMAELDSIHRAEGADEPTTPATVLRRAPRDWTTDLYPQEAADGSVIALRSGMEDIPQLVRIDPRTGGARQLQKLGPRGEDAPFGVGASLIAWSELRFDPRWGERSWSVIRTLDLATSATRTLTKGTRYFAPSVSRDDRRIACVEFGSDGRTAIVILDATSGREVRRIADDSATIIQQPRWSSDGRSILYVRLAPGRGRSLVAYDLERGASQVVVGPTMTNVAFPASDGRWVYYQMPRDGRDQLFATELATGRTLRVATRPIGATHPSLSRDGRSLLFEDGTSAGRAPARMAVDTIAWTPLDRVRDDGQRFETPLVEQEQGPIDFASLPSVRYPEREYTVSRYPFDVHSWYILADPAASNVSAGIVSRDLLGTLGSALGVEYDGNERTLGATVGASWARWYPIVDLAVHVGARSSSYTDAAGVVRGEGWTEQSLVGGVRLPLQLTQSVYGTTLSLGASVAETRISGRAVRSADEPGNGTFAPATYEAHLAHAYGWIRDIEPRWGQYLDATYTHTPFAGDFTGTRLTTDALLFAPGPFAHHSLWALAGFERQDVDPRSYRYPSLLRFARGYGYRFHERLALASANYTLPLAYPDLDLLSVAYLKRVRATAFFDWERGADPDRVQLFRSYGAEAGVDTYFFHYPVPLFLGGRLVRLIDGRQTKLEAIAGLPF